MAHLHFRRTRYKSGGGKASARIEYVTRQREQDFQAGERQLAYIADTKREDLVCADSRNLPVWATGNPHTYFQAAERYERVNGVAFEEWKITLPQELTFEQNKALMEDMVQAIAGDTLPITYAFHNPQTLDGAREQPHLHLLLSARQTDDLARTPPQHFRRYNADHPDRGGAQKSPLMNTYHATKAHRVLIADVLNLHLEGHGQVARIHPDRLSERGIDRVPEPKLKPSESAAYRERGEVSATMQAVLDTRQARNRIKEQNQARTYWEDRKATLGMTRDLLMAEKLRVVVQARAAAQDGPPPRTPAEQLAYEQRAIRRAIQREHARTGRGLQGPRPRQTPHRRSSLAAQVQRLARALEQEEAQGQGQLRVQLHDREEERGLSW